jgi:hypothetical protein
MLSKIEGSASHTDHAKMEGDMGLSDGQTWVLSPTLHPAQTILNIGQKSSPLDLFALRFTPYTNLTSIEYL